MQGKYSSYFGYEIDAGRCAAAALPSKARLVNQCAFAEERVDADLCIGNPPYVRNQDLPRGWRESVSTRLTCRTGISVSGLANAWQYFFLLSLASTHPDGLVAIVIPYEWVSRPSVSTLRDYIRENGWDVSVFRLQDATFDRVLTTSSITIVDKKAASGKWTYFEESVDGRYRKLASETERRAGALSYLRRKDVRQEPIYAKRGLSPGTQEVLVLTDGERVRSGLRVGRDVLPCVTSLRPLSAKTEALTRSLFDQKYRLAGQKCWLIRTDRTPSKALQSYLNHVPPALYQTATCRNRPIWWKFSMPEVPDLLAASGFRGARPKIVVNKISAYAIGGVSGIYGVRKSRRTHVAQSVSRLRLSQRVVPYSNGLKKVEINQFNTLLKHIQTHLP